MRQVIHALLTRPPLSHSSVRKLQSASFDLHVLGTPPAFILSQDQTLKLKFFPGPNLAWLISKPFYCCFRFCSECSHSWPKPLSHFYKNFQGFTYCSVFKVLCCCRFSDSLFTITQLVSFVNNFFQVFWSSFSVLQASLKRRRRDLNPRAGLPTYTLSRGASSASWVFLPNRSLLRFLRFLTFPSDACVII